MCQGTLCVLGSFPFIFSPCLNCEDSHPWAQLIYYSAFVIIFQFGWAAVQISHLSLIPDLTPSEHERTELTAIRYSFTVCSNVLVYLVTWLVLHVTNDDNTQIGPEDKQKFRNIVLIGIGIGALTSVVFHVLVSEGSSPGQVRVVGQRKSAVLFLKDFKMYQVAMVYMATRLFVNLSQVYIPLYLHESLSMSAESLAIVPLVMFLASFVTSLLIKVLNKKFGRKLAFLLGAVLGIGGCVWIRLGSGTTYTTYEIYPVASLLGAGSSIMLVTSLGITADLIGPNIESGAFVYGSMSFLDKLSNGLAVTFIQDLKCLTTCPGYYRDILTFVCGGAAAVGVVMVATLVPFHAEPCTTDGEAAYSTLDSNPDLESESVDPGSSTGALSEPTVS
ncbi:major facilitator superfamily domain-containing protein 12-like isoform X2 [Periplaneta americana]|uniref:major facilitator superfamily domain-containing protein 12-like isoform X2 n=1 Tax=Periplaneta americana TaxID=6978 RepID=UPI0037E7AC1F